MKNGRLKIGKAIALAALVSSSSLALVAPRGAESGGPLESAGQDNKKFELPSGAIIIEEQSLESEKHPDRALILWMVNPTKNPSGAQADPKYGYTCPDETRGSYYSGPTRVSLLDKKTRTIINTIKLEDYEGADSLDIPYAIRKDRFYRVESNTPENEETKPHIMWLKDYNGDGKTLEFALFHKDSCIELETTLIGYSERRDRVIRYPIYLAVRGDYGRSTRRLRWCPSLFFREPTGPGHWKYEIDYRGRAGSLDKYEVRYDAQKEMFVGKVVRTADEHEKR